MSFLNRFCSIKPNTMAILIAIILIFATFPEVIFKGASCSMTDVYTGNLYGIPHTSFLPEPAHRAAHHGYCDTGGAVFQSDPMIHFMNHALYHFESPYWNPYSAAGSFGPETLVDQKFSAFTILVAALGGSEFTFNMVVLLFCGLAVYFLFRTLNEHFNISALGATAACVVYLLNGYSTACFSSNVSQAYWYFPMLLFALCAFARNPDIKHFVFLIFANTILLTTSFFPTTLLILLSVFLVSLAYIICLKVNTERPVLASVKLISLQVLSGFFAVLLLAFLYFPVIESFWIVNAIESYNQRFFVSAKFHGLLSLFTPKHFWESYSACDPVVYNWFQRTPENQHLEFPDFNPHLTGNVIYHLGIGATLVATSALTKWRSKFAIIVAIVVIALALGLGRIFDVPLISSLIGKIFILRSIGEQYWWVSIATLFPILVGFGFEAIREKRFSWWSVGVVYLLIIGSTVYLGKIFGLIEPHRDIRILFLSVLIGLIIFSFIIFFKLKTTTHNTSRSNKIWLFMLLILIFSELFYYVNHYRHIRYDIIKKPAQEITFLKANSGLNRVANIGWYGLTPEYGAAYQIQQIESLNMNIDPSYLKFFQKNFVADPAQRWGSFAALHNLKDEPTLNLPMLNFLAVKYVVVPISYVNHMKFLEDNGYVKVLETLQTKVFENKQVYPRIFAVPVLLDDEGKGVPETKNTNINLRTVAFTNDQKLIDIAKSLGISTSNTVSKLDLIPDNAVKIIEYHHAKIIAQANLEKAAIVVLPDTWNPNWKVLVNGKPAYIGKVNEAFRGIALPAGKWTLELKYQPKTLTIALIISSIMLLILIILGGLALKNKSRGKPGAI